MNKICLEELTKDTKIRDIAGTYMRILTKSCALLWPETSGGAGRIIPQGGEEDQLGYDPLVRGLAPGVKVEFDGALAVALLEKGHIAGGRVIVLVQLRIGGEELRRRGAHADAPGGEGVGAAGGQVDQAVSPGVGIKEVVRPLRVVLAIPPGQRLIGHIRAGEDVQLAPGLLDRLAQQTGIPTAKGDGQVPEEEGEVLPRMEAYGHIGIGLHHHPALNDSAAFMGGRKKKGVGVRVVGTSGLIGAV